MTLVYTTKTSTTHRTERSKELKALIKKAKRELPFPYTAAILTAAQCHNYKEVYEILKGFTAFEAMLNRTPELTPVFIHKG